MADYKLSNQCEKDIADIYEFGIIKFGIPQARAYLNGMHELLYLLASAPNIGRNAWEIGKDIKRFNYKAHMVFYEIKPYGIFVVRILHHSRDYKQHS